MKAETAPRSSNLGLAKTFTQLDWDRCLEEAFEYGALFSENSLNEFQVHHPGYEGTFKCVDAHRFSSTGYREGADVAKATIYMGGAFSAGIKFVQGETTDSKSMYESLQVEADDQTLYLISMGMPSFSGVSKKTLTQEIAVELLWGLFFSPLQQWFR